MTRLDDDKKNKKKYDGQRYKDNREKILEQCKQWRENNLEYHKQYRKDHKEERKKIDKQWYENNCEEAKKYQKQHYKDNTEKVKKCVKEYNQTEIGKAMNQKRYYRKQMKMEGIVNTLTAEEWLNILKEYNFKCAYCGKKLILPFDTTRDHIIPISKGGNNTKENIVPACRSCNSRKNNKILLKRREDVEIL